jgi:outer membrane protein insertion porin family
LAVGDRFLVRARAALLAVLSAFCLLFPLLAAAQQPQRPLARPAAASLPAGGTITDIRIEGNLRIESGTIRSYMLVAPGDAYSADRVDLSLKTLYATGLFADVSIRRDGTALVVTVKENPIVNRIAFEGNHKLTDDNLRDAVQMKPRSVFTPALAEADRQRILDAYAKRARFAATVTPKIIELPQNRVDVVFEIADGAPALIATIVFIGNKAYSESRLRDVIGSRETAWWRFLSTSDMYDPERVAYDRELLRRYYLKNGYADFQVTKATAELTPDKEAFFLTYTLSEGDRYRISKATVNSTLRDMPNERLAPVLDVSDGEWYDGDAVERTIQGLTSYAQGHGQPFVDVQAHMTRDRDAHTIAIVFDVKEGPRVYVERIDITGNTRTKDKVIRREFRLAEGDAFNAALLRATEQRLKDLNYFNSAGLTTAPGSAPDRAIVNAQIEEKATGELTVGGGYSTDIGALVSFGIHERNLVGTGLNAGVDATLAQKESQVNIGITDPYFLDRNIVTSANIFLVNNNNQTISDYNEQRIGFSLGAGYEINEHLRQNWMYSLVRRSVDDIQSGASLYVVDAAGTTLLSQVSQTLTLDYTDSRLDPRKGWLTRLGTDFAGLGGDVHYIRTKMDFEYFIPLDRWFGSNDWDIAITAGVGYLFDLGQQTEIIDRFFLGGDNLRGFQTAGAGPHSVPTNQYPGSDSLGGQFIWTQSTELRFPLPVSPDLGLSGRLFVDMGGLSGIGSGLVVNGQLQPTVDSTAPRIGTGIGFSWKTPFGLINLDFAQAVLKQKYDQTQFFRLGFGTRF